MNKVTKLAAAISLSLILLASVGAAGGLYGRFSQTNEARKDNRAVWHAVICSIEQQVIHDPTIPFQKKRDFVSFYDGLLVNQVHARACGYNVVLPRR